MRRPFSRSAPGGVLLLALSIGLSCNFDLSFACPSQAPAANEPEPTLHLKIVQGADSVNIIKSKLAVKPVVEVRDQNNALVSGATVMFTAPDSGPRVVFEQSSNAYMGTTGSNGWAVVTVSRPIGVGKFKIRVSANYNGRVASTTITQTNYETVEDVRVAGALGRAVPGAATAGGMSATKLGIIGAGVAAAIIVGVVAGKGGGGTKAPPVGPSGTIGSGSGPSIGPPTH